MSEQGGGRETTPVRVIWYGRDEPLPERRLVRAGPLTAIVENGDLRYVKLGDEEIVRRIYAAVRDPNWGTVPPRFTTYEVESDDLAFVVRYTAEYVGGAIDFVAEVRIEGTSAGVITCRLEGEARTTFRKNRIGWCVLHPMDLAGLPAEVETPDGTTSGVFPDRISPHQPFFDMVSIRHPTRNGGEVTIRFEGDLFEMEDQRNWTDASYKTYSTPLRLGYPTELRQGERVVQSVTVEVRSGVLIEPELVEEPGVQVRVGAEPVGTLPPIGLGGAAHGRPLSDAELDRLRLLKPAHLRPVLALDEGDWQERLRLAGREARALGAGLELEVIAGDDGERLTDLVNLLVAEAVPVARLLVFPRSAHVTTEPVLVRAREAMARAGLAAPTGGGSRASFTELNRATLPLDLMDVVGYTINPQVHAFDNASLVETLAAQAATVESAKAIAGARSLAVGPVTLRPRFNPNATGPAPEPAPGELPPNVDPRQSSLFAAGWTVGSIRSLAAAGAAALTYYETTGWRGVIERSDHPLRVSAFHSRPGMVFPVYHVLADIAEFAGGELLPVEVSDPLAVEALALRVGNRLRLLVANFGDMRRAVSLALPVPSGFTLRTLDETTFEQAAADPSGFRTTEKPGATRAEVMDLDLLPFAVATLDVKLRP